MAVRSGNSDAPADSSSGEKTDPSPFQAGDPESWHNETEDSESSDASAAELLLHQNLGDFELLREIGRGGMGVVYEARQRSLDKRVAVKVLPFANVLDQRIVKRFKNEAWAAAQLQHRNIVPVYHVGTERGVYYYAMQYIDGGDLSDLYNALLEAATHGSTHKENLAGAKTHHVKDLLGKGPGDIDNATQEQPSDDPDRTVASGVVSVSSHKSGWSKGETLASRRVLDLVAKNGATSIPDFIGAFVSMGIQVADALHHAHEIGIVHRDIKPSNLLLDVDGEVWVADFGLAQIQAAPDMTATGAILGTLRYMSPEQAMGKKRIGVDHRTDIYSLGITLYELITLTRAFSGDSRESILHKITFEDPTAPRKIDRRIPVELETIVMKAISKNPNDRYQTAAEMADDMRLFRDNKPIKGRKPTIPQRATRWARRHRSIVASAAGILTATFFASIIIAMILWNYYAATAAALETEQAQKAEVERLLQRSDGLRLAANSTVELDTEPTRALLLAIESAKRHPGVDANNAILQALDAKREYKTLIGHSAPVGYVAFNSLGTRVISCSIQSRYDEGPDPALIWDSKTGTLLGRLQPTGTTSKTITSSLFYPNGGRILATSSPRRDRATDDLNGTLAGESPAIWDERTFQQLKSFKDAFLFEAHPAVFDKDGDRVVLPAIGNTARIYDSRDASELRPLLGHEKRVVFAAFSPDGQRIATASDDNTVRIWNAKTGKQDYQFSPWKQRNPKSEQCLIDCVAFRSDSQQLLTASKIFGTHLWDLTNGSRVNKESYPGNFAEYSPTGLQFISRFSPGASELTIRDSHRGDPIGILKPRNGSISESVISPDARWLAMQDRRDSSLVTLWNTSRRDVESVLHGHLAIVNDLAFSRDSDLIATASSDRTVRLWHVHNGVQRATYAARIHPTDQLAVASPDGQNFAVATSETVYAGRVLDLADQTVGSATIGKHWMPEHTETRFISWHENMLSVHSIADGTTTATTTIADRSISAAAINHHGDRVAASGSSQVILLWMPDEDRQLSLLGPTKAHVITFNPAGDRVASAHSNGTVKIWDADTGESVASLQNDGIIVDLSFSHDGNQLAVATNQNRAIIWDLETFGQQSELHSPDSSFSSIKFTADGLAAYSFRAASSKSVQLWDTRTGMQLGTLDATGKVHVAVHPTKMEALVASSERGAILWNYTTNSRIQVTDKPMIQCGYSTEGTQIYLGSEVTAMAKLHLENNEPFAQSVVEIWDHDGDITRQHRVEIPNGSIRQLFVGKSDQLLVDTVNRFAVVNFDVETHGRKAVMYGHTAPITACLFNSDSSRLVTVSRDHSGLVWDAHSGELLKTLSGHESPVTSATLADNTPVLITGDQSGKCILWDLDTGKKLGEHQIAQTAIKFLDIDTAGKRMIAIAADHSLTLRDLANQTTVDLNLGDMNVTWAEFSPDNEYLLVVRALPVDGETHANQAQNPGHSVTIVSAEGSIVTSITHEAPVISAHFHPDGKRIVTATSSGSIALYDATAGNRLEALSPTTDSLQAVAIDSTGEFIAATTPHQLDVWKLSARLKWLTIPRLGAMHPTHHFNPFIDTGEGRIISLQMEERQFRDWPLDPETAAHVQSPRSLTRGEQSRFYLPK